MPVHAVGKIRDLFAGVGIDVKHAGDTNETGDRRDDRARRRRSTAAWSFTNLVETDQVYGHRHDVEGFHHALQEIDAAVGEWLELLRAGRSPGAHRRPRRRPHRVAHRPHA